MEKNRELDTHTIKNDRRGNKGAMDLSINIFTHQPLRGWKEHLAPLNTSQKAAVVKL